MFFLIVAQGENHKAACRKGAEAAQKEPHQVHPQCCSGGVHGAGSAMSTSMLMSANMPWPLSTTGYPVHQMCVCNTQWVQHGGAWVNVTHCQLDAYKDVAHHTCHPQMYPACTDACGGCRWRRCWRRWRARRRVGRSDGGCRSRMMCWSGCAWGRCCSRRSSSG